MRFFRRGRSDKANKNFVPADNIRSIVDVWINNRDIPFIGRDDEIGLRDMIMKSEEIGPEVKEQVVSWAQIERGLRAGQGKEREG